MNSAFLSDGYKTGHHQQYPSGTTKVYSNYTPRSNKYAPKECDKVIVFGTQLMVRQLHEHFRDNFFKHNNRTELVKQEICQEIKREISLYLNVDYDVTHFEKLWDLGYLPIEIKALEEGTLCPIKVPMLTITNTLPEFYWITNYLETIISNLIWKPMTSASLAFQYKKILNKWVLKTDAKNIGFVDYQGHDFSMRGLDSIDATISSGLGHLTSFLGSDSLPTIYGARKYYDEQGFVACSVPATEHSVLCAGGKESELETFRRLLNTYPKGVISIVSDTWDLWNVCTNIVSELKEEILSRDGKLVIRPDSGDPVDIICGELIPKFKTLDEAKNTFKDMLYDCTVHGEEQLTIDDWLIVCVDNIYYKLISDIEWNRYDKQYYFIETIEIEHKEVPYHPKYKGVIELLWNIFGGTINEQGYKVLDSHIGAIYGDSITLERAEHICSRLEAKGFASTNIVLGIGSFTYQYNTRDSFGLAMKATYVEINGIGQEIFKDPITDDGVKKSAVGLLKVYEENGNILLKDKCSWDEEKEGLLIPIYVDGIYSNETTLTDIRKRLNG